MIKAFLFDELTPVALYSQLKKKYKDEITMLFESVVTTEDGNFSFITIGAKEQIQYINNKTIYIKGDKKEELEIDPFSFLQEYYKKINQKSFKELAKEVGFNFVDGFIGYIGYDMVKVFEPSLKPYMDNLKDEINIADLDLVRPKIIIGFSHKSSILTIIDIDNSSKEMFLEVEKIIISSHKLEPIKKAYLEGEGKFSIDATRFMEIVKEAKEHIKAGDIFQMLASNRYIQKGKVDKVSFYRILRSKNPTHNLF
ncbi:MAG: anthranilate synthase component I family protein, partial [Epsilonproteobacteria bacterium]|nr:anthranilate synthase component I family protein [Campylobacterota bacterium]